MEGVGSRQNLLPDVDLKKLIVRVLPGISNVAGQLGQGGLPGVLSPYHDPTLPGLEKAVKILDQCRLATSVAAHESNAFSAMELEAHAVEDVVTIIAEPEGLDIHRSRRWRMGKEANSP